MVERKPRECIGGPCDGHVFTTDATYLTVPIIANGRVLTVEEVDDPANWEWDPFTEMMRLRRPAIREARYVVDGDVLRHLSPEGEPNAG